MIAPVRGCGRRQVSGVYAVCDIGEEGKPIEWFLVDPPLAVPDRMALNPRGVRLEEERGIAHVFDWVGARFYENVADFVEEARAIGVSRRLPRNLDFSRLTAESRLVLCHPRACVINQFDYEAAMAERGVELACPKDGLPPEDRGLVSIGGEVRVAPPNHPVHAHDPRCAGVWWHDLTEGGKGSANGIECVERRVGDLAYSADLRPEGVEPWYALGVFALFPISRVVLVADPKRPVETEETRARIASQTWLRVDVEEA